MHNRTDVRVNVIKIHNSVLLVCSFFTNAACKDFSSLWKDK